MTKKFFSMAMLAMLVTSFVACDKGDDDNSGDNVNVNANTNVVDLGLPSGIKWATCNVGATNPWDYGNYYAWGEPQTKSKYHWDTYKYCNATSNSLTKYNKNESNGTIDNKTTLEPADDVATAVYGADYSIPTTADWDELSSQCYWVWTTNYNEQNVSGYIVYGPKSDGDKGVKVYINGTALDSYSLSDAHIFLPAAGYRSNSGLYFAGNAGHFWSSSLYGHDPSGARHCNFDRSNVYPSSHNDRCDGLSVRPVKRP
ncbi:MAG: hypothetical protein J6U04_02030 [Salinivirgaceae bacterium]|nr:hypothetical protein [Salinivirgaceae bacterium]